MILKILNRGISNFLSVIFKKFVTNLMMVEKYKKYFLFTIILGF